MDDVKSALLQLTDALDQLEIPYLIGGSIASSVRGVPRATMDIDLLARMPLARADRLPDLLGRDWYAHASAIRQALETDRSFNVIHVPSGEKFDLFPAVTEFHMLELQRALQAAVPVGANLVNVPVASAEDIILAKLDWCRVGGETTERQWTDVLNLIRINRELEFNYLSEWAAHLGVRDLLERAIAAASADEQESQV